MFFGEISMGLAHWADASQAASSFQANSPGLRHEALQPLGQPASWRVTCSSFFLREKPGGEAPVPNGAPQVEGGLRGPTPPSLMT